MRKPLLLTLLIILCATGCSGTPLTEPDAAVLYGGLWRGVAVGVDDYSDAVYLHLGINTSRDVWLCTPYDMNGFGSASYDGALVLDAHGTVELCDGAFRLDGKVINDTMFGECHIGGKAFSFELKR